MSHNLVTKYLKDYTEPNFWADSVDLTFTIDHKQETVIVESITKYFKNPKRHEHVLILDGSATLKNIFLDNVELTATEYSLENNILTLQNVPDNFSLKIITLLRPWQDKSCMGLYASNNSLITQCEPEGFRKITYYQDRPDVMAVFTTTIIADIARFPVALSNGNQIKYTQTGKSNLFKAVWHDPFKKPSYLFALVVADLQKIDDKFITKSKREIQLEIYAEKNNLLRCFHAMSSLKKAMQWDEERFNLEYDLDRFMIVATDDFNMGAMENKGLNIFNTKYVLADHTTATDTDFINVEAVIGHEYFHNWTGNRVTCRDWFQLSLKEGLTVFRDHEFTSDLHSRAVTRINEVKVLRSRQFPEDQSPLAHPVRPADYIEMNNFYTMTVYEKGSEVVRMYQTILGHKGFKQGMQLYFERHDGQAVTCEDFCNAMSDANKIDLSQFMLWYSQAGTPDVSATSHYNADTAEYTLEFTQSIPDTPNQTNKQPMLIPIKIGLLDNNGHEMANLNIMQGEFVSHDDGIVLLLTKEHNTFVFADIISKPTPSLLRGFSAPIKLSYPYTNKEQMLLAQHDTDEFNRFESLQHIYTREIISLYNEIVKEKADSKSNHDPVQLAKELISLLKETINNSNLSAEFRAVLLQTPTFSDMLTKLTNINPHALYRAINLFNQQIGQDLFDIWLETYNNNLALHYIFTEHGKRAFKNIALTYIIKALGSKTANPNSLQLVETLAFGQLHNSDNMTDNIAVLTAINNLDIELRETIFAEFYNSWKNNPLIMDKWFAIQAGSMLTNSEKLNKLMVDPAFIATNPNKIYALLATFTQNGLKFHTQDGYSFIADQIIAIDKFNPQVASTLANGFSRVTALSRKYQQLAKPELQRISSQANISNNVLEIVSKILTGIGI